MKNKRFLITAAAAAVLLICLAGNQEKYIKVTDFSRKPYGEGDQVVLIQMEKDGDTQEFDVVIPEMEPDEDDWVMMKREALSFVKSEFETALADASEDNPILSLPDAYKDCTITWTSLSKPAIDDAGYIWFSLLTTEIVTFEVTITLQDFQAVYQLEGKMPEQISSMQGDVQAWIGEQEEEMVILPDMLHGEAVSFYQQKKDYRWLIALLAGGIILWQSLYDEIWKKKKEKKRLRMLKKEFPEFLSQLILYLRAGMSIRHAWDRLIKSREQKNVSALLSELITTRNQVHSAMGEGRAYEEFGSRCGEYFYKRVGSYLAQATEKTGENLIELLEEELEHYYQEERNLARKKGEEAGTKLLIPTGIQFVLLMLTMMLPAIFMFQN